MTVLVRLKPAILDPQGKTIQHSLEQMGFNEVKDVRVGKIIELDMEGDDVKKVRARAEELSRKLLANPLMESFEIVINEC